jgi:hypothetical protein
MNSEPPMEFRWNDWNLEHLERHGVSPEEAEQVVAHAKPPYPEGREDDKYLVWGPGQGRRLLQVLFLLQHDDSLYIIHARPLTEKEKRRYRRRRNR